eukprot:13760-Heterococcus_DN1.PRE.1
MPAARLLTASCVHVDVFAIADQQQVHGAMITMVVPTSPAAEGGLRRYDVVTEMKGKRVKSAADAVSVVDDCTVGEPITVKILRAGQKMELQVKARDMNEIRKHRQAQFLVPHTAAAYACRTTMQTARRRTTVPPHSAALFRRYVARGLQDAASAEEVC